MTRIKFFDYLLQYRDIEQDILEAVKMTLESGRLVLGQQVLSFEKRFTEFLGGAGHSIAVNSGTDALTIALMAVGVVVGDEVVTVSNTAVPTVAAIRMAGGIPVFCDVDKHTALMDLDKLSFCLSEKTKAIVPVHLYGNVVDVDKIYDIVGNRNIFIVEDCAQAHGAKMGNRMAGTFGDASAFSFYPTKNLGAYGDAGICFCLDSSLAAEMRKIRMYGLQDLYNSEREGINSRMDEIQAAILNVKLPYLPLYVDKRIKLANLYNELLNPNIQRIWVGRDVSHAYHLFVIRVGNRDEIMVNLANIGVETYVHYSKPVHLMSAYQFLGYSKGSLPVTEGLSKEVLSLPLYPELDESLVNFVCKKLNNMSS